MIALSRHRGNASIFGVQQMAQVSSRVAERTQLESRAVLRTIAGAIGSAVFVGIMTIASNQSAEKYGSSAQIHGMNIAFAAMTIVTFILFLVAVFMVKTGKKEQ